MKDGVKGSKRIQLLTASSIAITIILCFFFADSLLDGGGGSQKRPRAAIVDGLLHYPNQMFLEEAEEILCDGGYDVDLIPSEEVTVDLYRRLPSLGYGFIVLRVHCGPLIRRLPDGTVISEGTVLFTAEAYDPGRYVQYQLNGQLARARITARPDEAYFAVPPWFFEECSIGGFDDAIVVLDSCYGFYVEAPLMMAEAFVEKGAEVFIGWDGEVQPGHSDEAALALLRALCRDGLTVEEAVERVMEEVGPDPYFGSIMLYHPREAGDHRLRGHKEGG